MAKFKEAEARKFTNVYVCRTCNSKQRSSTGQPPHRCRACGRNNFRNKRKAKAAAKGP